MLDRFRSKLTYANVTATLALFIALGGTSAWAATQLARNSVGSAQIRSKAVGNSELRSRAVSMSKLSRSARSALRGAQGPAGPQGPPGSATTYRAAVLSGGGDSFNKAKVTNSGNEYRVYFNGLTGPPADVSGCVFTATLAAVPLAPGDTPQEPEAGRITVGPGSNEAGSAARVRTYGADGSPKAQPFHITASC